MKRRSITKQPHDPHVLFLDEVTSGRKFLSFLAQARVPAQAFETLLRRNKKMPDSTVIEQCANNGYVLVTTDRRMESDWIEDIVKHKAKIIILTDDEGGPIHWTSALVSSEKRWRRILLDHPDDPITIRIERSGNITKVAGAEELLQRRDRLLTINITKSKRHGLTKKQISEPA